MKKAELEKLFAVLFLRNANQDRFGGMLLEYRKAYASNDNKYPDTLSVMIDVMRQQPLKSKKKSNKNQDDKNGDKDGNKDPDKGATSFAQDKEDGEYRFLL